MRPTNETTRRRTYFPAYRGLATGAFVAVAVAASAMATVAGAQCTARAIDTGGLALGDGTVCAEAPVLETNIDISVTGLIARARVTQRFINPTDRWVEGIYMFPLPDGAAVDHLTMFVGSRIVEGRIEERTAARHAYTKARDGGVKASLVEQHRANVFGTSIANIQAALDLALAPHPARAEVRQVVFITDGAVGNEADIFRGVADRIGATRLFTVGIGSAPNAHFMRKAAHFGRGTYTTISNPSEVSERMGVLFEKLGGAVMTDIEIDWGVEWPDEISIAEVFPAYIPDLYRGEPLVVTARLAGRPGQVILSGRRDGVARSVVEDLPTGPYRDRGIARLWARHKIDARMDDLALGDDREQVRRDVARLRIVEHNIELIVLAGASGRVLAFGPGHISGTATPGSDGNCVVSGHRDTHFSFLRYVLPGEILDLETPDGATQQFRVTARHIVYDHDVEVLDDSGATTLTLLTCYPFDSIAPGGPLRYVVRGELI